jgi:hypothetical protein
MASADPDSFGFRQSTESEHLGKRLPRTRAERLLSLRRVDLGEAHPHWPATDEDDSRVTVLNTDHLPEELARARVARCGYLA